MQILRYLLLTLLLTLPLLGMVGRQLHILNQGAEVALEIVPVDPRSLFRGDYVRLNYAISRLKTAELGGDDEFASHDDIYVTLVPEKGVFAARALFHQHPGASADQVVIRGRVNSVVAQQRGSTEIESSPVQTRLSVHFGIESYFVPEGTGRELEKQAASGKVAVLVAVLESGDAAIKGLRLNGSNHYIDPL